jgi:lambda repressor-like predicted transcriptional regulator
MEINLLATRQKLLDRGFTLAGFARANGINPDTFKAFFQGKYKPTKGEVLSAIHKSLKDAGVVVR